MNPDTAFATIHATLGGTRKHNGKVICNCPFCGDEHKHFAYSLAGWFKCVKCSQSGASLDYLAKLLRLEIGEYVPPTPVAKPVEPLARWRLNPWKMLQQYKEHPERFTRWHDYKPLNDETIEKHGLGYGYLWWYHETRGWWHIDDEFLTVPVYQDGALVRIHGRIPKEKQTDKLKWICNSGSGTALYGVESVRKGGVCFIGENYVDRLWLEQENPDWDAVAIGGTNMWQREWAARLAERQPGLVVVALDKDLVGNGGGNLRPQLIAKWEKEHPGMPIPPVYGTKIANDCIRAGLRTIMLPYPDDAPAKAGLDWMMERKQPLF